jgi:hypothetical protein
MPNTTLDERIDIATNEAKRFLRRVREHRETTESGECYPTGSTVAAVKRASMDLSRALADLRKGNS